jgi:photosystem II stability/assembly factor-like uncharacterized protein
MDSLPGPRRHLGRFAKRSSLVIVVATLLGVALVTSLGIEISHAVTSPGTTSTTSTPQPVGPSTAGPGGITVTTTPAQTLSGPTQAQAPDVPLSSGVVPGYGSFAAVSCPSTSFCMAVGASAGAGGLAADSTTEGSTWSDNPLPANTPELTNVSCATSSNCVAIGSGAIVTTSNGGASWTLSTPPTANTTLLGISCASASTCVASGVSPNSNGPYNGEMLYSANGGMTWNSDNLPAATMAVGGVTCPTATECIAVGASILVSSDGGQTWTTSSVAGGTGALTSVSCATALQCVAIGPNPAGVSDPTQPGLAIVTSNGGQSWQEETLPANTATLQSVTCASATSCMALGPSPRSGGGAPFITSADLGGSWSTAELPQSFTSGFGISCPSAGSCVMVGQSGDEATSASTNAGGVWTTSSEASI